MFDNHATCYYSAVRHRVLKWARFIFRIFLGSTSGLTLIGWRGANMSLAKNEMWASEVCFASRLYELLVRTLISRTNAYTGWGRPTLNFIEHLDLGRSVPTLRSHGASPCVSRAVASYVYGLC